MIIQNGCFFLFFIPFIVVGFALILESNHAIAIFSIIISIILIYFFQPSLKARTQEGRKLQDEIDGFKMFLKTTEPNKLKTLYPDFPLNLGTFEKLLPFSIALGLEKLWSSQFADLFKAQDLSTMPTWYHGSSFSADSFASGFSSGLSSSISSSSSSPGSSSGSGGGGSSGGGGGGGGGGGF
jgi:uncharacterized membrane protein